MNISRDRWHPDSRQNDPPNRRLRRRTPQNGIPSCNPKMKTDVLIVPRWEFDPELGGCCSSASAAECATRPECVHCYTSVRRIDPPTEGALAGTPLSAPVRPAQEATEVKPYLRPFPI